MNGLQVIHELEYKVQMEDKPTNQNPVITTFVLALIILGFAVPMIIAGLSNYLNPQYPIQRWALVILSRHCIWVWPFAIMMMVEPSNSFMALLVLLFSATLNASLYGLVGLAIAAAWKKIRG